MIYFENTYYLYLLVIVPIFILVFIKYLITQAKINANLGDDRLINRLIKKTNFYSHLLKFIILLLAWIFLVLALASPYLPLERQESMTLPQTALVLAVDVSKSMLAADVIPSRLAQAQAFILHILDNLHGEQVAIVVFSGKADIYIPLTSDYNFVKGAVKNISNDLARKQGTSIKDALKISSIVLNNKSDVIKVIGFISDGETSEPGLGKMADSIEKTGINLFAFGIGTAAGSEIITQNPKTHQIETLKKNGSVVISHLQQENLQHIVNNRPGRYYQLIDKELVTDSFITALQNLQQGKKTITFTSKSYFQLFLLISLILLLLEILI